jgi:hypothetical protein
MMTQPPNPLFFRKIFFILHRYLVPLNAVYADATPVECIIEHLGRITCLVIL